MQSRDLLRGKKVEAMAMMEVVVVVIISFANCLPLSGLLLLYPQHRQRREIY
jgi:hypothetical protein